MSKKAKYFCESCGNEVGAKAKFCSKCGRFFSSVRCPNCSFTGEQKLFINGCPECGYAEGKTVITEKKLNLSEINRFKKNTAAAINFPLSGKKNTVTSDVPVWLFGLCLVILAVMIVFLLKQ